MRIFIVVFFLIFFSINIYSQRYEPDSAMVYTSNGCKLIDYYYSDSLTYTWSGECESDWITGNGELTKYDRGEKLSVISANFKDGLAQGIGTYKIAATNERYKGTFVNGQMTGEGEYWNDGGDYYKGEIRNYILHGIGKMSFANGTIFEGTFNSFFEWTGKFINLKDEVIYVYQGEKVDKLPTNVLYNPKFGEELTEYFDSEWKRCAKKEATYFRKITYSAPNIPEGKIRDFYINGELQNEFYSLYVDYYDGNMIFYAKSKMVYYYKNGNPSSISFYNHQSRQIGIEYEYYESGELFSESHYGDMGKLDGPYLEFYKNGNLQGYSKYSNGARLNNAYWSITEDEMWIGVQTLDFKDELERFEVQGSCADVFEYSDLLFIEISEKDCMYYNSTIVQTKQVDPYSIKLDVAIDNPKRDNVVGLIFNYKDENNFSVLKLSGNGLYCIHTYVNDQESILVQWTNLDMSGSEKDKTEFEVYLSFISNELSVEINDVELNRIPFTPNEEMVYGLYSRGKGLAVIREFGEIVYYDAETSKGYQNFALAEREGKSIENEESEYTGNGSGFLITNDGYIGTNYHVIEDVSEIKVVFNVDGDEVSYNAEIIQTDKDNDVAILKVDLQEGKFQIPYSLGAKLQEVGSSIFTLGYPYADIMGSEIKYTDGSINARTGIKGDVRFYQVSAPVQPGNSGGPCFNENGEIIGIVSAGLNGEMYENQNVNYVLKISYLKNLMELLPIKSTTFKPRTEKYSSTQSRIKDFKSFVPIIYTK